MTKIELQSAVIITNKYGHIATLRFNDHLQDKIFSHSNKYYLYTIIERYVQYITRY